MRLMITFVEGPSEGWPVFKVDQSSKLTSLAHDLVWLQAQEMHAAQARLDTAAMQYRGTSLIRNRAPLGGRSRETHAAVQRAQAGFDTAAMQYRGSSFMRNCDPLGPYSRHMPRALW